MNQQSIGRILIMAGGTGGHVFPALAVAKLLAKRGWQVCWLGTADRLEAKLVPQYGFDIHFIDIKGVRGNGLVRKLTAPFKIAHSILQAIGVMRRFKPNVVLGMGGFASGPGGVAAKILGIPLVLHEQNTIPGVTNKLLSHVATRVLSAFDGTFPNSLETVVGNPVREELIRLGEQRNKEPDNQGLNILVIGGSLGAKIFNELLPEVMAKLSKTHSVTLWHQVGKGNEPAVLAHYQRLGQSGSVKVVEFINDMEAAYRWADVVICRSGALTVSELAAVGCASILVPYPYAVDDHQTRNAKVLVDAKAGFLLPQSQLTVEQLFEKLNFLAQERAVLKQMGTMARQTAVLDSTAKVADMCESLAKKGSK